MSELWPNSLFFFGFLLIFLPFLLPFLLFLFSFCSENASFYIESDDYRRCPGPSYRILKAKRLFERYISDTAELQVNVPSGMAREITAILQRDGAGAGAINVTRTASIATRPSSATVGGDKVELTASSSLLFVAAQREIFLLMHNDSMTGFLASQTFKNYRALCQAKV